MKSSVLHSARDSRGSWPFLVLPALLACATPEILGATYDWVGGSGDWDTKSPSWTGPQATWPAAGADNNAVFGLSGGTVTVVGGIAVDDLSFTAAGYRIDGGALTLTGPSLVSVDEELSATIACEIAGAAGITLAGPGTLSLRGASSYTGSTTVNAGTLKVTGSGRLHSGVDAVSAVVTVNAGATLELDTWFVGDEESLGRLPVDAQRIVVNGGTIRVNGETGSGRGITVNAAGATLEAAAGADWLLHAFGDDDDFTYNGNPSLTLTGAGTGRFDKPFSGSGSVIKRGPGKWTLGRTNSYTGDTIVEEGVLGVARASLDDQAAVSIAGGALMSLEFFGGDAHREPRPRRSLLARRRVWTAHAPAVLHRLGHPGRGRAGNHGPVRVHLRALGRLGELAVRPPWRDREQHGRRRGSLQSPRPLPEARDGQLGTPAHPPPMPTTMAGSTSGAPEVNASPRTKSATRWARARTGTGRT